MGLNINDQSDLDEIVRAYICHKEAVNATGRQGLRTLSSISLALQHRITDTSVTGTKQLYLSTSAEGPSFQVLQHIPGAVVHLSTTEKMR